MDSAGKEAAFLELLNFKIIFLEGDKMDVFSDKKVTK